jgi:hypothetical protein
MRRPLALALLLALLLLALLLLPLALRRGPFARADPHPPPPAARPPPLGESPAALYSRVLLGLAASARFLARDSSRRLRPVTGVVFMCRSTVDRPDPL